MEEYDESTCEVAELKSTTKTTPSKTGSSKEITKKKMARRKKRKVAGERIESTIGKGTKSVPVSSKKSRASVKKRVKIEPQRITVRDDIPKLWDAKEATEKHGSYTFKILSWNVAGLRSILKKEPNAFRDLATKHNINVLCLQETKLQEMHLSDPKLNIKSILVKEGYDSHYSCSTVKKGYSGTAVFIKRLQSKNVKDEDVQQTQIHNFFTAKSGVHGATSGKSVPLGEIDVNDLVPNSISYTIGKAHDGEGRIIVVDFPHFFIVNCYVPNSGQKLERLSYRTEQWDTDLLEFMQKKQNDRNVPGIWLGDLNVAHKAHDVWNDGATHLKKQAGVTQEERDSFQRQLDTDGGAYVDAFRHFFPEAKGHYSYWSQRAKNRNPNKGLRLDYFVCSKELFCDEEGRKVCVRDCYMIQEQEGSDHCPVVLEIEIRK